ncbi:hypothetical protein [Roseobacter sp. S98]|uniref:hypothetical protein n=1 Tax=Roseobacter algicola (ex Choi et al. 2025) (nom. illeg.) TaxID=3092138 RepID=UPI0035C6BAED
MLLGIVGNLVAFLAAGIAIVGNTWDANRVGIKRLRPAGWFAICVALAGFGVSMIVTWQDYQDRRTRQSLAMAEVEGAWSNLAAPFRLLLWELDGSQSNPDAAMIERLIAAGGIESLDTVDLRGEAPHHHGEWMANICGPASRGRDEIRRLQAIYVGILETELIAAMQAVAASHVPEFMSVYAPCGTVNLGNDYPIRFETVVNHREMRGFLRALLTLRHGIDKFTQ